VAVISNRITNNRGGIVVSNLSTPSFRNNLIANNQENGLVILKDRKGQPTVDLGTTTSSGQNIFQNNKQTDINNASGVTVVAIGNQADPKRIQGSIELVQPTSPIALPITPSVQVSFKDVPSNYWAQTFIQELASRDIIKGFPDGSFRPNDPVTRAQFAALLSQAMNKPIVRRSATFADVKSTFWAATAIQKAYTTGFMSGYSSTTFRPSENISRVQILVSLANGLSFAPTKPTDATLQIYSDAVTIPAYARNSVAAATENRMVVNYPNLKLLIPNQPATRAEVAAFIYQSLVRSGQIIATTSPYIVN
jgi:parallel beta-helix repeat protein